jgi:hypothetical protein
MLISPANGQGVKQFVELGTAFLLSAAVGLEREIRQKSAGLRTYTIVGTSAALFLLISKYGFNNVLSDGLVVLDPSRVAAQIVSGIGFIGAGLIFCSRRQGEGPHDRGDCVACHRNRHGLRGRPIPARDCGHTGLLRRGFCFSPAVTPASNHSEFHRTDS